MKAYSFLFGDNDGGSINKSFEGFTFDDALAMAKEFAGIFSLYLKPI